MTVKISYSFANPSLSLNIIKFPRFHHHLTFSTNTMIIVCYKSGKSRKSFLGRAILCEIYYGKAQQACFAIKLNGTEISTTLVCSSDNDDHPCSKFKILTFLFTCKKVGFRSCLFTKMNKFVIFNYSLLLQY